MKVALIHTPYREIYGPDKSVVGNNFPLGITYLSSYLKKRGHKCFLFDPEATGQTTDAMIAALKDMAPDLIGISAVTSTFLPAKDIAKKIKKQFADVPLVIGGPHASALPELVLKECPEIDISVFGEGEATLSDMLSRFEKGASLENCLGCAYRKNGKIIKNESRPFIWDMDSIPFPDRDSLDISAYKPNNQTSIGKRSLPMLTSRGCPFGCVFCSAHKILGRKFRPHSPEYVANEIELLVKKYKVEHIALKDDTFTVDKKRVFDICDLIHKRNIKIPWTAHATVSTIDEEVIKAMRGAGCFCILFGVESGDPEVAKKMGKGITLDQVRKAVRLTDKYGIKTLTSYIFGLPGDTRESVDRTIDFACSVPSTISMFFTLVPYPGSKVFDMFVNPDSIESINWQHFAHTSTKPLVKIPGMSEAEMLTLVSRAYKKFYGRPSQLMRMLSKINSASELSTYFKGGLGLLKRLFSISKHNTR